MTAIPGGPAAANVRRQAAVDLGLWLVGLVLVAAIGFGLSAVPGPAWVRLLVGEPAEMIVLLAVATWLLRRRGETWRDVGLRRPASLWKTLGFVAGGLGAVLLVAALLVFSLYPASGLPLPNLGMVAQVVNTPWRYGVMIVLVWTTVAFGEEMQFRGFAFSRLERLFGGGRGGAAGALLGQALIFGLLHSYQGVGGMVSTSLLGLVLGGVFLISRRNLVACILLHGLMDTLSLTAVFYMATHAGTEI